ncbi:unnamed protein product [Closterium sp. NIES-53]
MVGGSLFFPDPSTPLSASPPDPYSSRLFGRSAATGPYANANAGSPYNRSPAIPVSFPPDDPSAASPYSRNYGQYGAPSATGLFGPPPAAAPAGNGYMDRGLSSRSPTFSHFPSANPHADFRRAAPPSSSLLYHDLRATPGGGSRGSPIAIARGSPVQSTAAAAAAAAALWRTSSGAGSPAEPPPPPFLTLADQFHHSPSAAPAATPLRPVPVSTPCPLRNPVTGSPASGTPGIGYYDGRSGSPRTPGMNGLAGSAYNANIPVSGRFNSPELQQQQQRQQQQWQQGFKVTETGMTNGFAGGAESAQYGRPSGTAQGAQAEQGMGRGEQGRGVVQPQQAAQKQAGTNAWGKGQAQDGQRGGDSSKDGGTWVTVYGFLPEELPLVLRELEGCGRVVEHVLCPGRGNWVNLRFQTAVEAQRALGRSGQQVSAGTIIGVMLMQGASSTSPPPSAPAPPPPTTASSVLFSTRPPPAMSGAPGALPQPQSRSTDPAHTGSFLPGASTTFGYPPAPAVPFTTAAAGADASAPRGVAAASGAASVWRAGGLFAATPVPVRRGQQLSSMDGHSAAVPIASANQSVWQRLVDVVYGL